MNRFYLSGLSAILALGMLSGALAQGVSPSFTYQGFLRQGGALLTNPSQPMTFRIYDAPTGGSLLWNSGALNVNVENGLFSVQLNAPASVWSGAERFLEIQVGGTTLAPRVRLNPTPYANTASLVNRFSRTGILRYLKPRLVTPTTRALTACTALPWARGASCASVP